ncbi:MAG: hypothetical protein ABIM74_02750 [candidate division WOR-3 bacterium]
MSWFLCFLLLISEKYGGSECGYPTGQFLKQVILTYIDTSGAERSDTLKEVVHYKVYAREGKQWIYRRAKCWQLIWQGDTARSWIIPDTVLVFVISDDPPCGKPQKEFLVAEKFYWMDRKGRYKEWEPDSGFSGKKFRLYKDGDFYYIAHRGYCLPANPIGDVFEVQFGGDTVGVFRKVAE